MENYIFDITAKDDHTAARTGKIHTAHGDISTPTFVPVGSSATIKSLTPAEIRQCGVEIFFVNTYHMLFRPGIEIVKKMGGLHKFMNWDGPIMTDSGGFQAFSLGDHGPRNMTTSTDKLVKITQKGIYFKSVWEGNQVFLGPKESVSAQQTLGSDIMMSFDECTFYPIKKQRAREAMERTHQWALDCLKEKKQGKQALYGIVQGSVFKDLRQQSAKYLINLPFEGYAIGSVANSKEPRSKVFSVLDWTLPHLLSTEKPIHFLGVGEIEDILRSIEKGIDSLDCITPTRLARMGFIFSFEAGLKNKFRYDLLKKQYSSDKNKLAKNCHCFTCQNFTRSYLHHLFRCRELLAYRLATIHNLTFFSTLMENIRQAIYDKKYYRLKKEWLGD